jgi:DNA-3-methyladenine glycosylase
MFILSTDSITALTSPQGNVPGKPEAVLIRALEPMLGDEIMGKRRGQQVKFSNLSNGPSKLCMAMDISKTQNKTSLNAPPLYIEDSVLVAQKNIVKTTRVGVDYSGAWKNKPWRFYIRENRFISVK